MAVRNAAVSRSRKSRRCPRSEYSRIEHKKQGNFQHKETRWKSRKRILSSDDQVAGSEVAVASIEYGSGRRRIRRLRCGAIEEETTVYRELWSWWDCIHRDV